MASRSEPLQGPETMATSLIDPRLTRPKAIVAAMMAEGYVAIARVADGAAWEGERDFFIAPGQKSHAARMALIWARAAENLQGERGAPIRPRPRNRDGLGKGSPCGLHSGPSLR